MHAVGILISGFFQPAFSIYKLKGLDVYQICVTDILDQNYESIPRKLQWFVKVFLPSVFIWTHTFFSFGDCFFFILIEASATLGFGQRLNWKQHQHFSPIIH